MNWLYEQVITEWVKPNRAYFSVLQISIFAQEL